MHTVTITGNPHAAVEWAMANLDEKDWDLDINFAATPSYRFTFNKMGSASYFALRWKDV